MKFSRHQGRTTYLRVPTQQGFSLIELMIAVSILGILLAIAVPSFNDAMLGSKLRSYSNNFLASTYQARGEAIRRNAAVNLCASSNGTSCGGNWEQGWILMCNTIDNEKCDPSGLDIIVIQRQAALSSGLKMTGSEGFVTIVFPPTGVGVKFQPEVGGVTQATFTVCRATPSAGDQERVITINSTGRATITKTTEGSCP